MLTDQTENSLLDRIQNGYRAGLLLQKKIYATEAIKNFIEAKRSQMNMRYYETLRNNAFEATLLHIRKADTRVTPLKFEQKFKQNFEEQLLIYCYRKQSPSQQTDIHEDLGNLLDMRKQAICRDLKREFKDLTNNEVQDLAQDAIEAVLKRLKESSFKLTCSLENYLSETANNMAYQYLEKQNHLRRSTNLETIEREVEYEHAQYFQRLAVVAQRYIQEKSSSNCQAFLEVYWRLKSPFDFMDPSTKQLIREDMVKERLGLTDLQLSKLKNNSLKLTQKEALQLVSGKQRRKQKANDFYQDCISALLHHVGEHANIPWLTKDPSMLAEKEEDYVAEFKKILVKWMRTARKNPTTTY